MQSNVVNEYDILPPERCVVACEHQNIAVVGLARTESLGSHNRKCVYFYWYKFCPVTRKRLRLPGRYFGRSVLGCIEPDLGN